MFGRNKRKLKRIIKGMNVSQENEEEKEVNI
jgi:hypothetical protein